MKLRLSTNGRQYTGTYDVVQHEQVFTAKVHLSIERGEEKKELVFESKAEMIRFENKVVMCRAKDSEGNEVYVSGF